MLSFQHILLVLLVVVLLFGRGKISEMMGDVAKGIRSFKKGLSEDDEADKAPASPKAIEGEGAAQTVSAAREERKVS